MLIIKTGIYEYTWTALIFLVASVLLLCPQKAAHVIWDHTYGAFTQKFTIKWYTSCLNFGGK